MFDQKREPVADLVQSLKIAAPCNVGWNSMQGDERIRHCAQCNKNVYNISTMTEAEANEFLFLTEQAPCVTFYRRGDGTVLLENCPVGLRKLRNQYRKLVAAIATGLSLIQGILVAATAADSGSSNLDLELGKPTMTPSTMATGGRTAMPEPVELTKYRAKANELIGSALPKGVDMGNGAGTLIVASDGRVQSVKLVSKSPSPQVDEMISRSLQSLKLGTVPDACKSTRCWQSGRLYLYFECRRAQNPARTE